MHGESELWFFWKIFQILGWDGTILYKQSAFNCWVIACKLKLLVVVVVVCVRAWGSYKRVTIMNFQKNFFAGSRDTVEKAPCSSCTLSLIVIHSWKSCMVCSTCEVTVNYEFQGKSNHWKPRYSQKGTFPPSKVPLIIWSNLTSRASFVVHAWRV
jgi:hypothetical protein